MKKRHECTCISAAGLPAFGIDARTPVMVLEEF
jgi:hypothetical protein